MSEEARWEVLVDGDTIEVRLRPRRWYWSWVPAALLVPVDLLLAWGLAKITVEFTRDGLWGPAIVFAALAWFSFRLAVQAVAWLSWTWTGMETTRLRAAEVVIERDGLGIGGVRRYEIVPGTPIRVGRCRWLTEVLSVRLGLSPPGYAGAIAAFGSARDVRFGYDLSRREAMALVREIALVQTASRGRGTTPGACESRESPVTS